MGKKVMITTFLFLISSCKTLRNNLAELDGVSPREDRSYEDLGVSPDCDERAFNFDDLNRIVEGMPMGLKDPQQYVLDKITPQSMQTFTVSFSSESAQSPGISKQWPGIIRMNQDGSLIIRYVCDPSVDYVYNHIEAIVFDDTRRKFDFIELDLTEKVAKKRIHHPEECAGCHNVGDIEGESRPNWADYPDWEGMYGSHDDFFPTGDAAEKELVSHDPKHWELPDHTEEQRDYLAFVNRFVRSKEGEPSNPCYASVPWPKPLLKGEKLEEKFAYYPYGSKNGHAKARIYALRPNLKFTEVLSKRLALRNFRMLSEHPSWGQVRGALALEAAACTELSLDFRTNDPSTSAFMSKEKLDSLFAEALGDQYKRAAGEDPVEVRLRGVLKSHHDPRHPLSRAQGLYGVWNAMGFAGGEMSLKPFEYAEPEYRTGAGPGEGNREFAGDLPLTAYIQYEILADVVKDHEKYFYRATGESDDFGDHFQCIDDIAGPRIFHSETKRRELCQRLLSIAQNEVRNKTRSKGIFKEGLKRSKIHLAKTKEAREALIQEILAKRKRR